MKNLKIFKRSMEKDQKKVHRLGSTICVAALAITILPITGCSASNDNIDVTYYESENAWFLPFTSLEPKYVDINSENVNINHIPSDKFNELLSKEEIIINDNGVDIKFDKSTLVNANNIAISEYETRKISGMASQLICVGLGLGIALRVVDFSIHKYKTKQKIKENVRI